MANPRYEAARAALSRFAELEKSPEYVHTYRITPLSLWNAAAGGMRADEILGLLREFSKFDLPPNVVADIRDEVSRYGRLKLIASEGRYLLIADDEHLLTEVWRHRAIQPFLLQHGPGWIEVEPRQRGRIKQALIGIGYPVEDLAGYSPGAPLAIRLVDRRANGEPFALRPYQREAVEAFYANGAPEGGSGVIVLPCGAGKTIVGIGVIAAAACATLILTTHTLAVHQWIRELLDKTDVDPAVIGEYTGDRKEIKPITVTTYQTLTHRRSRDEDFPHLALFEQLDWGLIIYDEVHLLPAPIFRATAQIQAKRRLGLTATLVREDGLERDVFSLIGPRKHDVPWRDLEKEGYIAEAVCHEVRIPLPDAERLAYALAEERAKFRLASENPAKAAVVRALLARHRGKPTLIIGQFIHQLERIARALNAPLITGRTPLAEREAWFDRFIRDEVDLLVVSKVANFSLDLPSASVAIQLSGTFGSRQEEAQRLGRILRPKSAGTVAHFYSLVTRETKEQEFAANRQRFLTEQGYQYWIHDAEEILGYHGRPGASGGAEQTL
ncbi:MAG TPA: DNA repair helicase XPB [Limnochordia bacterium]